MIVPTPTEFRFAARRLRAAPLFTVFAVLSLAVGVGVTAIAYSVVSDLFFTAVGVRDADGVGVIVTPRSSRRVPALLTPADYEQVRRAQRSFLTLSASSSFSVAVAASERTMLVVAEAVDGAYFQTVGVDAALGRTIQPSDEASRLPVAVLGHAFWREQFASDPDVIGRAIRIGGITFDVIGVAADGYAGIITGPAARQTAVWIPLDTFPPTGRSGFSSGASDAPPELFGIGRLRPDVRVEAATEEVAAIAASLDSIAPRISDESGVPHAQARGWSVRGILEGQREAPINRLGLVMVALVTLVLIVACTNLSNLVLARGTIRQQDVAVRRALGAGDWRLIREQLAESVIIAAAGGLAAGAVMRLTAAVAARDLSLFAGVTLSIRPDVDMTMLSTAAAAVLISLVVFGLEPAIRLVRTSDVRGPLAATVARMGRLGRYRVLLRWQVCASTAFFIIAVMAVRYVVADLQHDPGVRLDGLVVAQLDFGRGFDETRVRRAVERMREEGRRARALEPIAVSNGLPFGTPATRVRLSASDSTATSRVTPSAATLIAGTPNLLPVLGIPVVRGRAFADGDDSGATPVAVVSERAARDVFGTSDVVGRVILVHSGRAGEPSGGPRTIVGVAADTDTAIYMAPERGAVVCVPLAQRFEAPNTLTVRAAGDTGAAVAGLQAAVRTADPDVAIVRLGPGWEMLAGPFTFVRFIGNSAVALGAMTLLLAMVGLYGIQSQAVTLRRREIGVRLSFGATTAQVRRMVLRESYRPVLEGLLMGLIGGVTARAIIVIYLDIPIGVFDPWMLALVPMPLVLAAFCAGYLPARRAAGVNPAVALRDL
jgi:predicted permease